MKSDTCENYRVERNGTLKWGRATVRNSAGLEALVNERSGNAAMSCGRDARRCSSEHASHTGESSLGNPSLEVFGFVSAP